MNTLQFFKAVLLAGALASPMMATAAKTIPPVAPLAGASTQVHYQTAKLDGVEIFYREAGPKDAPVILLLHGFPTSSQMFRNLIPLLADRYHLIAPDYPVTASARCRTVLSFHTPSTITPPSSTS